MSPKKNTHKATFPETVIPEELQSNILVDFNSISFPFPNHNVREKLKGSAITSRNIDNLGIGSVNLYGGNTVSYREVKKDVDLSDFYEATSVEFTKLSSDKSVFSFWEGLKSDKDLKWHHSPLSNSEYLVNHHTGDIYRFSDHWGKVASCEWSLNDDSTEGWSIGVANIQSFKSLPFSRSLVLKSSFVNQLNQVIANLHDIIDSTDIKKTDSALRTLNKRLDDLKSHKASLKDWKVYIENANLIKSKDISDMAYKKTNAPSSASSSYSDAVIQQFADMMIKRMEDMKESNWKKGWMDGRGDAGFPRNALTGRQYNGINPFMLMYDTIKHEYTTSMYLTARQLFSMNDSLKDPSTGKIALENLDKVMKINKGEKAFPVYYMIHKYKDMQGKEYSDQEYNDLSEEQRKDIKAYFYPKVHHLFNIDQTNMKEVNPSLYNSFVDKYTKRPSLPDSEGMYINEEIDSLLAHSKPSVWKSGKDNLSWYCPIEQTDNISSPHYNLSKDFIKVPLKNQYKTSDSKEGIFADGQAFYATLLHEMAHSTGPKGRLNRDMNGSFGDKKYAKEELVAELSAALISSTMGFDKRINDNNAKYVSSWLKVLKEEPSFIKTVLSDVGKASDMIIEKIDEQRVDLNQTLLRGSNLKGQDNELSNSSRPERTENEMSLNELIDYQVETDTGNRTKADTNHYDDKRLYLPLLVDGKTSHLAVETVVPDAITAPSYQRTVYNFGDEVEAKVDNVWQKWEDISNEYNLSAEDADRSVVDSDAPSLKFRSVDSAVKFADWIAAKYVKTEQKSDSLSTEEVKETNKKDKTLYDLQAQYSNINAQYPAAVNDERTRQLAKRIRQAEQIITAYNANVKAVYGESFMFSPEAQTMLIPQTIYSGRERPALDKTNATSIEEPLSTKSEIGILSSEGMPKVDLQSQWGNIKKQINSIVQEERQGVNFDFTKDISLARDYIANNFQVSGEIFDSFSDSDKERLVSLYSNYSSSLLSSFTEERKVEKEISDFILLGGLLDPENAQKVLEKGYEKMNLLRETPNVNLAVLKSSVLSLADNQHRDSNSIAYGQYDIPIWAVKHLSEGKDSSLSEAKLSEIESFKSQLPNNSFFEFKESNIFYSEKPAFGPATNVIKAHIYVSRDQHQEESVSINKSVNDSEEYTMARRLPQQDSKKNEEIFYSSVVSIKSGEDFHLFDSMREKGHLNKMLKVAAEYDSGDAISLDTTHKSPLQNSGDEVLRENKNYAVVYNNSAGGAYEIFRKSPQSEILNSIERYGLSDTASEDVKSLSGRKDYSSDHDLYEATQHEDHDALKFAAASRGMTPKQMEESLAAGTEEKLPDSSELDKKRGLDDREKEISLKNEELSGEVSSKLELQDKNVEARRKEESQREAEKKEKEKQESQKKDDSSAKIITAAFLRSSLLSTALLSAKDNNRVWLNAGGKQSPTFHQASWDVSPYNQIFMSLNSDKNGYATNVYTTFKHEDSLAVKKGSESLPYSWTDWSMYKSKGPEPKSITSSQYENLSPDEKEHFMKSPVKYDRKIFNIDQTVLKGANPEQYNAVLKEHDTHYKEMQTIASTDSVDLVSDRVSKIKKQHPDHLVLFAHNGVYNAFGKDAKTIHQLAKDSVTLNSINNSKSNRKTSIAFLKPSDLDKVLKAVVSSGQRVAVADNFEVLNAPKEATKILSKAESVLDNYSKSTGINVQKSLTQPTSYDKETDTIILNNKKPVNPGSELRTAVENSNAIYFAISQSVANNKRLDISNQFSMPEKDIVSVKQLIATVSAGVLSLKQAHPAILSDQVSNESVESWVQDIKNDPHLLSSLERNVNNTVNTIEKLVKGEQVDYAAINGKSSYNRAESFNLVSELNEVVNTSTMSAAVIRNNDGKSASVILSKGIESISKNGVLNNEAFRQALMKQGIKEVKFFNPGGTLGLNKGDSYFEDKSIQIVNFDGKEVVPQQELHLNEQSQNVEHNFEDVSAVKDDNNRWHLYIKEKDQPYFIIQPEMRDMSRLFEAFKSQDQQAIYDTKTSLGEKYTKLVQQRPELKVDFLMPKVPAEDITRIEKANIARDAQDKNKYLIFATIDGKGYHHEISREDFRRMWKVDNMQSYKSALAAKVFSNVLHEGQTVSEAPSVEENQQIKETNSEKVDSPKQSTESEESLSPRVGRSH
ncbi:DNA primase TraC [Prevotella melaninogenica]|uniref:zincin-like metallopeptidase domain-containing protein n=1 Tax=Prevotella melaninogenica TaxID=28132 RepID=UPI0019583A10|nr:zincin-like metallopeptidase domain-containing protein [Prevotella melaninogenica]VTY02227.1 DNA primase TraC [Prevotella melaninogenica]